MTHTDDWRPVWERKGAQVQDGALDLSELLRANGYDTGHGDLTVDAWTSYTQTVLDLLGAESGQSLYEIGCGAGAFRMPIKQGRASSRGIGLFVDLGRGRIQSPRGRRVRMLRGE